MSNEILTMGNNIRDLPVLRRLQTNRSYGQVIFVHIINPFRYSRRHKLVIVIIITACHKSSFRVRNLRVTFRVLVTLQLVFYKTFYK